MAPALPDSPAPWRHRLSTRIVALSAIAWALVLAMVGGTLWLSWQLEGAGAAINDAGSLRMRASEKTARSIARGACSAAGRLRKDHRRSRLRCD